MITPFTGWSLTNSNPSLQLLAFSHPATAAGTIDIPVLKALTEWCPSPLYAMIFALFRQPPRYIASGVSGLFANCLSSEM
jgi:hypothetical protein